jgi:hypothetical protein
LLACREIDQFVEPYAGFVLQTQPFSGNPIKPPYFGTPQSVPETQPLSRTRVLRDDQCPNAVRNAAQNERFSAFGVDHPTIRCSAVRHQTGQRISRHETPKTGCTARAVDPGLPRAGEIAMSASDSPTTDVPMSRFAKPSEDESGVLPCQTVGAANRSRQAGYSSGRNYVMRLACFQSIALNVRWSELMMQRKDRRCRVNRVAGKEIADLRL